MGLVHVQVWREEHQVWPVNLDGNISAEGLVVSWPEDYDLDDEPFAFRLVGWSDDDSYPHVVTFRFALLPLEVKESARAIPSLLKRLTEAIFGSP